MIVNLTKRVEKLEPKNVNETSQLDKNRAILHNMINELFDVDEMRDLYFMCGLDYDAEIGNKSTKIWHLVRHYTLRESVLAQKCKTKRIGLNWPFLDKHE